MNRSSEPAFSSEEDSVASGDKHVAKISSDSGVETKEDDVTVVVAGSRRLIGGKEAASGFVLASGLPYHSFPAVQDAKITSKTVRGNVDLQRIAVLMDSAFFTPDSINRAFTMVPRPSDVFVVAPTNCGQAMVNLMVRYLCAKDEAEFAAINEDQSSSPPWIECSLVDDDPEILNMDQPGTNRVFRTTLSHSMLSTMVESNPEARFIYVCRHPLHSRTAFYHQLRQFYVQHQTTTNAGASKQEFEIKFDKRFTPDDVMNIPMTVAQITCHQPDKQYLEMEYNTRDWVNACKENQNCLMVMFEEILCSPEKVLRKVAKFLKREKDDAQYERILAQLTGTNIVRISRRNSLFLTPDQETYIKSHAGGSGLSVFEENRLNVSTSEEDSRTSVLSDVSSVIDDGVIPCELSARTQLMIRTRWADVFLSAAPTYENLYESVVGEKYPLSKQQKKKAGSKRLTRWGSSYDDARGTRSNRISSLSKAVGRIFRSTSGDEGH